MSREMYSPTKIKTAVLLTAMVLLTGCAATQEVSKEKELKSHFLTPKIVAQLKEGEEDDAALLSYLNHGANWASYNKVIVSPVTIWKDEGTKDVSPEDLQRLANDFWSKIQEELKKDYKIAHDVGPGVMKLDIAITEAEASDPTMDTFTSVIPQTRLLTGAKGYAAGGKPGFVGAASVEMKLTDSQSGTLLAAAIDRRAGTKNISGATNEWGDIEEAYTFWSKKMRWRLCTLREKKKDSPTCEEIKPEA